MVAPVALFADGLVGEFMSPPEQAATPIIVRRPNPQISLLYECTTFLL